MDLITGTRDAVARFAEDVGPSDPVVALGGGSDGDLGGALTVAARGVRAPAGVVSHEPEEMVVRCGAGTTVAELHAVLAEAGQRTALPVRGAGSTVGGVLSAAVSDVRRLRLGPVRDALLEARYVAADGAVVRTGAPVVKNVTGYDLCRLLCGSLGTLGLVAEVVLRTLPRPPASVWLAAEGADPFEAFRRLYRPSAVLWDGTTTWVLLEGHADDLRAERDVLGPGYAEVGGPPDLPPVRRSLPPRTLRDLPGAASPGTFVAEVGVGTVHSTDGLPGTARPVPSPGVVALHRRLKAAFDPSGRLAPGRDPLAR